MSRIVSFRQMKDGTKEDYLLLDEAEKKYAAGLGGRVLESLRKLDHSLEGYPVSRLGHSLQAATRALRDGADEELVVAALIHDIGDELAPYNHAEVAAGDPAPLRAPRGHLDRRPAWACSRTTTTCITSVATGMRASVCETTRTTRHACTSAPPGTSVPSTRTTQVSRCPPSSPSCSGCLPARRTIPRYIAAGKAQETP